MHNAVTMLRKLKNFLGDCRNYVAGQITYGDVDETAVLAVSNKKYYSNDLL